MKKLPLPRVNDSLETEDTANNSKLHRTSYPHLRDSLTTVFQRYNEYDRANGNAWRITDSTVADPLKKGLQKNYAKPPVTITFLEKLRKSSPDICPMCGSPSVSGTLDHILPQEDYPEFAIFSKNLVPACHCNSLRKRALKGNAAEIRVFHPYYDHELNERLLSCQISPTPTFPQASIVLCHVNPEHPKSESLQFHVDKIIEPAGIIRWLEKKWDNICTSRPSAVIHTINKRRLYNVTEMAECIEDAMKRNDESTGTPNNWESIFLKGLLDSDGIVDWLVDGHNRNIL